MKFILIALTTVSCTNMSISYKAPKEECEQARKSIDIINNYISNKTELKVTELDILLGVDHVRNKSKTQQVIKDNLVILNNLSQKFKSEKLSCSKYDKEIDTDLKSIVDLKEQILKQNKIDKTFYNDEIAKLLYLENNFKIENEKSLLKLSYINLKNGIVFTVVNKLQNKYLKINDLKDEEIKNSKGGIDLTSKVENISVKDNFNNRYNLTLPNYTGSNETFAPEGLVKIQEIQKMRNIKPEFRIVRRFIPDKEILKNNLEIKIRKNTYGNSNDIKWIVNLNKYDKIKAKSN